MKAIIAATPVALVPSAARGWLEMLGQWLREPAHAAAAPLFDDTTTEAIRIAASARAAWLRGH